MAHSSSLGRLNTFVVAGDPVSRIFQRLNPEPTRRCLLVRLDTNKVSVKPRDLAYYSLMAPSGRSLLLQNRTHNNPLRVAVVGKYFQQQRME